MREIKFRAWDGKIRKMLSWKILLKCYALDLVIKEHNTKSQGIVSNVLMQFTGLKDKNGKEIYEGDIVDFGYGTADVVFYKGCFCIMWNEKQGHIFGGKDCEVIGNIYENPELLKENKK